LDKQENPLKGFYSAGVGYAARNIADICLQRFNGEMPFYNMDTDNYFLPDNNTDEIYTRNAMYGKEEEPDLQW